MAADEQQQNTAGAEPGRESVPKSIIAEPVASLMVAGLVQPPSRPGLLGVLDHYELLRELGKGGMGLVFLARDTESGRMVTVKMVRTEFRAEPRVVHRFLLEARHLQKLKAPGIVPVLEICERGEGSYLVMPYFERGSLAGRMQPGKTEDAATALQISSTLAGALSFAHRKGITHRDLKPANILLGNDGSVCLADFGLARTVFNDSILDLDRDQCEGTPAYMSPAVAAGEAEDTRCDIYSLGAVLYEMLTGQPPYQGSSSRAVRDQIIVGPPKPIREINPKADPQLTQIAEWAMARAHRDRYASMADLAGDLRRIGMEQQPIGPHAFARQVPWTFVLGKNTGLLAVAAGGVTVLVLALMLWPNAGNKDLKKFPASQSANGLEATNSPWAINSFDPKQVLHWDKAVAVDAGGVPGKELLVISDNRLLAVSSNGHVRKFWPLAAPFPAELTQLLVTEGHDGLKYGLFLGWSRGTSNGIVELNANFFEGKHFEAHGAERDPRDTGVASVLIPFRLLTSEESRDGRKKMIAAIQTNFSKKPRGLCCFDYETGRMEWQRLVGPMLENLECLDVDGDGLKDFICGSGSSGNGNVAEDGTDDSHSYIFAWSSAGKPLWCTNMSGTNSGAQVLAADLEGRGQKNILVWVHRNEHHHSANESVPSKIVQLDYQGNVVRSYEPATCLQSCLVADLNHDGREEIICSDCMGDIHILGPHLDLISTKNVFDGGIRRPGKVDRAEVRLIAATSLLKPGTLNLLVQCWMTRQDSAKNLGDHRRPLDPNWEERPEIVVLDTDLNRLAHYAASERLDSGIPWAVQAADLDGDGVDEILSLSDHVEILKLKK